LLLGGGNRVESAKEAEHGSFMDRNPVTHNEAKGQFEIALGSESAVLQYHRTPDSITLIHTEVPEPWRGRGLGDQLIRAALDYAHFNQLKVVPVCPFVKAYLKKHPEAAN
jgi:predicted GNAT family acetyltransferase